MYSNIYLFTYVFRPFVSSRLVYVLVGLVS